MNPASEIAQPPESLGLALTPQGHLVLRTLISDEPELEPDVSARVLTAFSDSTAAGLLHLGAVEVSTSLPPVWTFWRELTRRFLAAVCAVPELETLRERLEVAAPISDLEAMVSAAPPMEGGEYLSSEVLLRVWDEVLECFRAEVRGFSGTVQALLAAKNAAWNVVGHVHFHLAENKRNPELPFAFLASYTTGLSSQGKPQHRPLGEALRASSSARDKSRLLALLTPVQKAAAQSPLMKDLVDSGELFQPLAWTASQAYQFLKTVPALEASGVVVRMADCRIDVDCDGFYRAEQQWSGRGGGGADPLVRGGWRARAADHRRLRCRVAHRQGLLRGHLRPPLAWCAAFGRGADCTSRSVGSGADPRVSNGCRC